MSGYPTESNEVTVIERNTILIYWGSMHCMYLKNSLQWNLTKFLES
jgi:hypothetical protein